MLDDMMAAGGTDVLLETLGDAEAVEVLTTDGPRRFPAIVGRLAVEELQTSYGVQTVLEQEEVCRVQIRCDPQLVRPGVPIGIAKYNRGDASTHAGQRFTVRRIAGIHGELVAVELVRTYVADIQRQGYEIAARI